MAARFEMSRAVRKYLDEQRELIVCRLIEEAVSVLHHDTSTGSEVDVYERDVLRKRFTAVLQEAGN